MKQFKYLVIVYLLFMLFACKKKETETDPYLFLQGTWKYENGAECIFDETTKTAKGTKVPTNNIFGFKVGEDYWRNVTVNGTDSWDYEQIVRFSDGKTVEYRKSILSRKSDKVLFIKTPGLADSELTKIR